ncbi:MAG TPA: beta-galactosidase [bacterium]|jgi:hypothetical protein|nr:beta-galactosidase [bacterium]HOQ91416.1 beta-galactosidase [bacterium]HPL22253.1 beta-galactosidase [bacterium]HPX63912.1 beta-galactosidase [bacterium]HQA84179.1 beta-galactosidase [bacterium]
MIKKIRRRWRWIIVGLTTLIILGILWTWLTKRDIYQPDQMSYGLTFSPLVLQDMGLDWRAAFIEILDDLAVKRLRLVAYWPMVEPIKNNYDFSDLDWQIEQAEQRNAQIILAVGARLPRWPECHYPQWYNAENEAERQQQLLSYLQTVIERYDHNPAIAAWQIENEPFLIGFGECPKLNVKLLDQEIALARSLTKKPIVITDSGELSIWLPAAKRADIFGTSIYRHVYSKYLRHYVTYPMTPNFFRIKTKLVELFTKTKNLIVIEMQAEPWGRQAYFTISPAERNRTMNMEKLQKMLEFSRQSGFQTIYLWGVEWWYWEKQVNHNSEYWQFIKNLLAQSV